MLNSICIVVTTYNRKKQTEICLSQLKKFKGDGNQIWIFDDGSTEYGFEFLSQFGDQVFIEKHKGIEQQRKNQILLFNQQNELAYLYLTDNDAFHDHEWVSALEFFRNQFPKYPISLYNTEGHKISTIEEHSDYYIRYTLPGISILLDKSMTELLVNDINLRGGLYARKGGFDWRIGELFKKVITSKVSFLEHYGYSGMHSKLHSNGDWAINPTVYLEDWKPFLISYFEQNQINDKIKELLNGLE